MQDSEIIEGNTLIAQFIGLPKCRRCDDCGGFQIGSLSWVPLKMDYHKSWDWIMPVLLRIKGYIPPTTDEQQHERLMNEHGAIWEWFWEALPILNIETIWHGTVAFCKWWKLHNPNKIAA